VLGPVLDVGGIESPVASRAFSDDADAVSEYARSAIGGYRRAGILAAPEHFPGLGAATQATDAGPASVGLSIPELIARDLRPFAAAIRSGARAVVVGHASYASDDFVTPASQSSAVIGDLLRERLGFEGLAIADDLASPAVLAHRSIPDAAIRSLRAGADMVLISESRGAQEAAYHGLLNAVRKGELSRTRLDQAVLRVLTAKERAGMIR
jgi:beta-N-acetylhexosaminidase